MLIFFDSSDLAEVRDTGVPNIIIVGGFGVRAEVVGQLCKRVRKVKDDLCDDHYLPVKWNMRDNSIRREIKGRHGPAFFPEVLCRSEELRSEMLACLREADGTCFASIIHAHSERADTLRDVRDRITRYSFVNLLQRVALCARDMGDLDSAVVLDWPSGNDRTPWEEEYHPAWERGESYDGSGYVCGALREIGFRPGVHYGNTLYEEELQLADLVVGATREFVQAVHRGDDPMATFGGREFASLKSHIHDRRAGIIVGRGLVVSPATGELAEQLEHAINNLREDALNGS